MGCSQGCDENCECIPCHFAFEEEFVFPYLPEKIAIQVAIEHKWLEDLKYPPVLVVEHALWENEVFKKYLPRQIYNKILKQHNKIEDELCNQGRFGPPLPPPGFVYVLPIGPQYPMTNVPNAYQCPVAGSVNYTTFPDYHSYLYRYPNYNFWENQTYKECKFVKF